MKFERGVEPKETLQLGLHNECLKILEQIDGVILDKAESADMDLFESDENWEKFPPPATAADFMKTNALTKYSGSSLVIRIKGDTYTVSKNLRALRKPKPDTIPIGWSGNLQELYEELKSELNRRNRQTYEVLLNP